MHIAAGRGRRRSRFCLTGADGSDEAAVHLEGGEAARVFDVRLTLDCCRCSRHSIVQSDVHLVYHLMGERAVAVHTQIGGGQPGRARQSDSESSFSEG